MEDRHEQVINIIRAIRESFGSSIAVYTQGNCYQFYEILKSIFPDAEAYESPHVFTKIDGRFYDIRGELKTPLNLLPVENNRLIALTANKYTDERRKTEAYERFKLHNAGIIPYYLLD